MLRAVSIFSTLPDGCGKYLCCYGNCFQVTPEGDGKEMSLSWYATRWLWRLFYAVTIETLSSDTRRWRSGAISMLLWQLFPGILWVPEGEGRKSSISWARYQMTVAKYSKLLGQLFPGDTRRWRSRAVRILGTLPKAVTNIIVFRWYQKVMVNSHQYPGHATKWLWQIFYVTMATVSRWYRKVKARSRQYPGHAIKVLWQNILCYFGNCFQVIPEGEGQEPSVSWARYQMAVTKYKEEEKRSSSMSAIWDGAEPVVNFQKFIDDNENIVDVVRFGLTKIV